MLKINFENQILAHFDGYFWPYNKSQEKIQGIFVISATMALIWNVFIKFRWHDEKLSTEYSSYVKSIATYAPIFFGYNNSVIAIVRERSLQHYW